MRTLAIAVAGLTLMACANPPVTQPALPTEECYLNVSYVRGSELSRRVWQHVQAQQYNLIDSGDRGFGAALWYTPGDGRAGFVYRLNCEQARGRVQAALEQFAQSAASPEVAQALRDAKRSVREVTQAQFEDAEPL